MTKLTKTQKTRGIIAASILGLTAVTGGAAIAASETITDKSELNEMRAVESTSIGLEAIVRDAEARSGGKAIEAGAEDEANGVVFQVETIGTDGTVSVQRFGLDGGFLDSVAPSGDGDGEEKDDALEIANAKVSLADAIATVAANGQPVLEAGYDDEDGKAVIEVETVSGDTLTEVLVDADTGQVMAQSADTDSDDADEGDDDGDMEKGESADDKS